MGLSKAIFAGGCFWGVEHFFKGMVGVSAVVSGYSGGHTENPTYDDLLDMFFKIHDPTTIDRQGPDIGEQYKSVIFYASEDEMNAANEKIKRIDEGNFFKDPIVTEVRKAVTFYKAEEYHQDFIEKTGRMCYHQMYVNQNQTLFNTDF